jgi:hypothetical protein
MVSFSGGSGLYQATTTTYASEALALAGTYSDAVATRTFSGLAFGTYWVALRDKNNISDKIAHSFVITTCSTTTTTTLPPLTYDFSATCTSTIAQDITINNFAGGDGTNYYANTVTYADAMSAAAGATTLVIGGTRTFTSQAVGTRYVYAYSATRSLVKNGGNSCATTTTTTAGPTTTTTQPQVWYNLYNCSSGVIETSASFPNGTFAVNQRVVYGGSLFFYVTQVVFSNPGGIQWSVSSAGAGLTFCPSTTTTTTTIPPLAIVVTISCDNTQPGSTYLGKASVAITGGSGLYQIKAGFVPTYSTLVAVTTDPFVITSPTANYDGTLGLRNTTGGSDKFLVYVIDSFGTIVTAAKDINCTITTTTTAP